MAEEKTAAKKKTKKAKRTNLDCLEFILVDQTVRRFVRPDNSGADPGWFGWFG